MNLYINKNFFVVDLIEYDNVKNKSKKNLVIRSFCLETDLNELKQR